MIAPRLELRDVSLDVGECDRQRAAHCPNYESADKVNQLIIDY